MSDQVNRIIVVGGGTAGWLTASIIAAEHCANAPNGARQVQLTLIESPDIPTIGVGEGTWPSMRATLQKIGVSENDFLRTCSASFKQGTYFQGWQTGGNDAYAHPFTVPNGYAEVNLAPHWLAADDGSRFADAVGCQSALFASRLAPKQITTPEYAFLVNYGYHLDAAKFASFLRDHCVDKLGVQHIQANVTGVNAATNGDIQSLSTDVAGAIEGDLFIDCSGARSLLLAGHFEIPFVPLSHVLFNDTALASQVPYVEDDAAIESCTLSTAQSAGWIWDIGLPTRRGIGHVYSSAHTSEDQAAAELRQYISTVAGEAAAETTSFRKVQFNPGHRARFWHQNCVAIGMSAGFIEPLEASALVMVELSASMIADQLPANRHLMDLVAKRFNEKFAHRWRQITNFLKLHYALSRRDDTDYWRDNRRTCSLPEELGEMIELWKYLGPWHRDTMHADDLFPSASYQYIVYGMGIETSPEHLQRRSDLAAAESAARLLRENAEWTQKLRSALPTNRELLNKVYSHGFQKL